MWSAAPFLQNHLNVFAVFPEQEQVSGGTTSTVLRNLLSDTLYTVTVAPVYPEGEGKRQSEKGKTCKEGGISHTFIY